jgi:steroid 5-alpha reductase family enzyme
MLIETLIFAASTIILFVSLLFVLSVFIKRNDIADIAWGTGIFLVSWMAYLESSQSVLTTILLCLAGLWGIRLTIRILLRNIKKSEDYRYKVWRDSWGKWFYLRSFFQVYLLQGFLMLLVGYPFVHFAVYGSNESFSVWSVAGIFIWSVGYFFEVVGDYQLDKFIQNPENKGKIMNKGLWRYSRHPNYFGEVTMWWGIWILVAPVSLSYLALISPLTITFLILKVSGVPMLEKKFAGDPKFEQYKNETSVFFPLPPKLKD